MLALVALAPTVHADENDPEPTEQYPPCWVFQYSLDPPGYTLSPDCLFPLPKPVQDIVDELIDPDE